VALASVSLCRSPLLAQQREEPPADATPAVSPHSPSGRIVDEVLPSAAPEAALESDPPKDDRLLYTLPNFLTVEVTPRLRAHFWQKFKLVAKDSFDIAEYPFLDCRPPSPRQATLRQNLDRESRLCETIWRRFADNTIAIS